MVEAVPGRPAEGVGGLKPSAPARRSIRTAEPSASFRSVLAELERSSLTFSRHARRRIEQRELQLDGGRMRRLEQAVDRAREKGSRDSLILLDELALVVSVQSQTVVTAMEQPGEKEQVFTNIDSVVIAD
ncbi:MAG: TIGR02530 family flagellar biosynthesis protein [Dehalococcoidia bacterium]